LNVANGDYNFIHWTTPDEETRVWAKEAMVRGVKKVSVICLNQQGEIAIAESLKKELEKNGVEMVSYELFNAGDKDFKTIIMKAKKADPDMYMLLALSPEMELIAKQIRELGIETQMSSIEAFELTEQRDLFEGEWYVNAADPSQEFADNYEAKYGKAYAIGAPNSYDIFNLIVEGFETAGDGKTVPSSDAVVDALMGIKGFDGALGKLDIGAKGLVWSEASVRKIVDGKPVTIN
jgi:branched-chain amino acid transport system substrate-binding protein